MENVCFRIGCLLLDRACPVDCVGSRYTFFAVVLEIVACRRFDSEGIVMVEDGVELPACALFGKLMKSIVRVAARYWGKLFRLLVVVSL